ncbi:MAG TPA: BadF/BadG/BcrA/BcrD ATPase family protein [Methylomirabilota bacterium]|nr:BadF/BadG/BcrA/BcrD ATPase family protein [Methylomirabilota bacterium]
MNRGLATSGSGRPVVVVDLGGTWVRVVASGPGRRVFRAPTPGVAGLPAVLDRLWRRWRLSRRDVVALGVASRGIWTTGERRALARRLRRFARRVVVISDVEAAYLGALGGTAGVLLLAGTGSIALGCDRRGRFTRAGGLGPLLGDDGSAFAIGRAWLRAGSLTPARIRGIVTAPDAVARVAALAPSVLRRARRGDRTARRMVSDAQRALADLALRAAPRIGPGHSIPVSWAGGLLGDLRFRSGVWRALRRRGVAVRPIPPAATAATPAAWRSVL